MERRKAIRLKTNHPARLTVLGVKNQDLATTIVDLSCRGLRLKAATSIAAASAVKIQTQDVLLLGEVRHCDVSESGFLIGIEVQHVLTRLRELAYLNERLVSGWRTPKLVEDELTTHSGQ